MGQRPPSSCAFAHKFENIVYLFFYYNNVNKLCYINFQFYVCTSILIHSSMGILEIVCFYQSPSSSHKSAKPIFKQGLILFTNF
ncbi:hypothetical protein XELAEV_18005210mg [Xenopus laevis]|uniref:Uncharacterized protein n=1 Tax=Xenopus laevis TaxID=8355 RepID=A0A974DWG6_XENLA|nr:hypothetical protein XELAEV_18005210mg [Xenopus laevis]